MKKKSFDSSLFVIVMMAVTLGGALGCGSSNGSGTAQVMLGAEESITEGLTPGSDLENIVDGWEVQFDQYIVAIGDVHIEQSDKEIDVHDETVWVVDLTQLPPGGLELTRFEDIEATRWDFFGYRTPHAEGAERHESVPQADFDEMAANDWTYLIAGTLTKSDGESCPPGGECAANPSIAFRFGANAEAEYRNCSAEEGLPGFAVTKGSTTAVEATLHGDHIFFDAFPTGAEIIERRAQWLANADTNVDGEVTRAELEALDPADLFASETYSLGGSPMELTTAWDYIPAQLTTQGHFQGEGSCQWCVDGMCTEHDHDHDHDEDEHGHDEHDGGMHDEHGHDEHDGGMHDEHGHDEHDGGMHDEHGHDEHGHDEHDGGAA
jgi:hypothetical protein